MPALNEIADLTGVEVKLDDDRACSCRVESLRQGDGLLSFGSDSEYCTEMVREILRDTYGYLQSLSGI